MKRFMLFVQIALFCFVCAASAQASTYSLPPEGAEATITEQEAIRLAKQAAAQQQVNLPEEQITWTMRMLAEDDQTGQLVWIITFDLKGEKMPPAFSASIDAESGEVLFTTTEKIDELIKRWEEELELKQPFWDLGRQYVFDYGYYFPIESASIPQSYPLLPTAEDLPLPQAIEKACEALAQTYHATSEELNACRIGVRFTNSPMKPVWIISFYSRETEEFKYEVRIRSRSGVVSDTADWDARYNISEILRKNKNAIQN